MQRLSIRRAFLQLIRKDMYRLNLENKKRVEVTEGKFGTVGATPKIERSKVQTI
jgi:hypothetical protein